MGSHPPANPPEGQEWAAGNAGPGPEYLPPEAGATPPPRNRPRRSWAVAPATYALVGINCAVFVLMFISGTNPFNPSVEALQAWGGDNVGRVLYVGEWWRIVSAMFVHGGFLHLALNMWCLWNLGLLAEPLMGSAGVFIAYVLTGAAGNLLSTLINWFRFHGLDASLSGWWMGPVGVGASGAVFGIAGALIILLKSSRLPVPPDELKKLRRSVIYFAAINLIIGFSISVGTTVIGAGIGVDNWAHVGGCACGLLFAAPMVPRIGSPRRVFNVRLRTAVVLTVGVLVLFGFYLAQLPR